MEEEEQARQGKEHKCLALDLMVLIILVLQIQSTFIVEPSKFWLLFCFEVTEGKRGFFHPITSKKSSGTLVAPHSQLPKVGENFHGRYP